MTSPSTNTTNVSDLFSDNEATLTQLLAASVQTITAAYERSGDSWDVSDLKTLNAQDTDVAIDPKHISVLTTRLSSLPVGLAREGTYRLDLPTLTLTNTIIDSPKDEILAKCRAWGLTHVTAEYNGSGDDGCIEDIHADRALTTEKHSALEDFAWDVIESQHPGFEINDGGSGNVFINVEAGTVKLEHNTNVMETIYEVTDL